VREDITDAIPIPASSMSARAYGDGVVTSIEDGRVTVDYTGAVAEPTLAGLHKFVRVSVSDNWSVHIVAVASNMEITPRVCVHHGSILAPIRNAHGESTSAKHEFAHFEPHRWENFNHLLVVGIAPAGPCQIEFVVAGTRRDQPPTVEVVSNGR